MTKRVVILGCGQTKRQERCSAEQMYLGSMWQTFRKHAPEGMVILVVSAEHGLMLGSDEIDPYERTLTAERSAELAADPQVRTRAARVWDAAFGVAGASVNLEGYAIAGEPYVQLLEAILPDDASFEVLDGDLLAKRSQLRGWLSRARAADAAH